MALPGASQSLNRTGDPRWDSFIAKNLAEEQGLHPLQNWIHVPYVFTTLEPALQPSHVVGYLTLDLEMALDLESGPDLAPNNSASERLRLKLDSLCSEGLVPNRAVGCWAFLINALQAQLQSEHADLSKILSTITSVMTSHAEPLVRDSAALCGCAIIIQWAVTGRVNRQQPYSDLAVVQFVHSVTDYIKGLGDEQQVRGEERGDNQPDGSSGCSADDVGSMPMCRAATLAHATYWTAYCLFKSNAFVSWGVVWKDVLAAGFSLARRLEAVSDGQLAVWQMVCLHRLHALLALPAWYAKSAYDGKAGEQPVYTAASLVEFLGPIDRVEIMHGHVSLIRFLTKPYLESCIASLTDAYGEVSDPDMLEVGMQLVTSSMSVRVLLGVGMGFPTFLSEGGVATLLAFLSCYSPLQDCLPWDHVTHEVAQDCLHALNTVALRWKGQGAGAKAAPQVQGAAGPAPPARQQAWQKQSGIQLLVAGGGVPALLAVLRTSPPLATVLEHYAEDKSFTRYLMVQLAFSSLEYATRTVPEARRAVLGGDGLKVVVQKGVFMKPGAPLGEPGSKGLLPVQPDPGTAATLLAMVRGWVTPALMLTCHVAEVLPGEARTEAAWKLLQNAWNQIRKLMGPFELVGLLEWRAKDSHAPPPSNQPQLHYQSELEVAVLCIVKSSIAVYEGQSKVFASDSTFVGYLVHVAKSYDDATRRREEMQQRILAWDILRNMLRHCQGDELSERLVGHNMVPSAFYAVLESLQAMQELERLARERAELMLRGKAGQQAREADRRNLQAQAADVAGVAREALAIWEALMARDSPTLRSHCQMISGVVEVGMMKRLANLAATWTLDKSMQGVAKHVLEVLRRLSSVASQANLEQHRLAQEAAEAAAAALLAEEEEAQQASAAKAAKRQRQKAARQQAALAAQQERERREGAEREERERREAEEAARKQREKEEKAAEAEAAARLAEEQAEQRRAAAKAAKRQRHKATKASKPPQQEAGSSAAGQGQGWDAFADSPSAGFAATLLTTDDAGSGRAGAGAGARLEGSHPPKASAGAGVPGGAPAGAWCPSSAGQPVTPQQAEARAAGLDEVQEAQSHDAGTGGEAALDDQDAEFQVLLSLLLPGMQPSPLATSPVAPPSLVPPPAATPSPAAAPSLAATTATCSHGSLPASDQEPLPHLRPALAAVLTCRLTGLLLRDPVIAADGYTYERGGIAGWLQGGGRVSPVTGLPLASLVLRPNFAVRELLWGDTQLE